MNRETILNALHKFASQRPGLEFGNYGDLKAYRAEMRSITKDLAHARTLLRAVELRESITAEQIIEAADHAYSGRLSINVRDDGKVVIDYCTGQYWPTEYRRAVCAVLSAVLWAYWRDECMPQPVGKMTRTIGQGPFRQQVETDAYRLSDRTLTAGDWLRTTARREFGRGIASRWFN